MEYCGTVSEMLSEKDRGMVITTIKRHSSHSVVSDPVNEVLNATVWRNGGKSKRIGGKATWGKRKIELHNAFFHPERTKEFRDTFLHEVGHLINSANGFRGHGKEWKAIMRDMGYRTPSASEDMPYLSENHVATSREKTLVNQYSRFIGQTFTDWHGVPWTVVGVNGRANKYILRLENPVTKMKARAEPSALGIKL